MKQTIALIYFLFSISAEANLDCSQAFTSEEAVKQDNALFVLKTREIKNKDQLSQNTMKDKAFINALLSPKAFDSKWKLDVFHAFPELSPTQSLNLIKTVAKFKQHGDPDSLDPDFLLFLIDTLTEKIPLFDKNQLIEVLYAVKQFEIKPNDNFIKIWRKSSLKKMREYKAFERFHIRNLFMQLGIGVKPLRSPYNLNSGISN